MTLLLLALSTAWPCGGLFCNAIQPVEQTAEGILFVVDEAAAEIEMHVQITYAGPADEFAWVVPVPADPQLRVGVEALFPILDQAQASFGLTVDYGRCGPPDPPNQADYSFAYSSTATTTGGVAGADVEVVRSEAVGPYETVTLQASSTTALTTWLVDHGFALPPALDPVLAPYVASDSYFVALRLAKDRDTGDLEPLVLRYAGTEPMIPIQLTSVAATPDMRLVVYVAGAHRAVPSSYLHVEINPLAIDWWNDGINLNEVVTRAADEAGGHAFYTEYSGEPSAMLGTLHDPAWDTVDYTTAAVALDLFGLVVGSGMPYDAKLLGLLADHTGLPADPGSGQDVVDGLNCAFNGGYSYFGDCTGLDALPVDGAAFAADLEAELLEPRRSLEAALGAVPTLTRMTSTVSPSEMTVDPSFVFNPDMPAVDSARTAHETWFCAGDQHRWTAPRTLTLADGQVLWLPSKGELQALGLTEFQWIERQGLADTAASVIERTSAEGAPEVLVDNRPGSDDPHVDEPVDGELDPAATASGGCGCATGGTSTIAPWALLGAALARRRRRGPGQGRGS